ncbi:hypothetical protein OM416_20500 [Paenibacillus sp. LS1]|uniref:hypothetical protein n=1 Tax=Paenibacillus sp. LS1 TaxID=2992120 RepID=UPI00223026A7|nr:hypothetical protein [Paenibacillus sp. LS1]MCW3793979.1 hypothetical protein [Paenibacillus sp. LS1]
MQTMQKEKANQLINDLLNGTTLQMTGLEYLALCFYIERSGPPLSERMQDLRSSVNRPLSMGRIGYYDIYFLPEGELLSEANASEVLLNDLHYMGIRLLRQTNQHYHYFGFSPQGKGEEIRVSLIKDEAGLFRIEQRNPRDHWKCISSF